LEAAEASLFTDFKRALSLFLSLSLGFNVRVGDQSLHRAMGDIESNGLASASKPLKKKIVQSRFEHNTSRWGKTGTASGRNDSLFGKAESTSGRNDLA
jgi:hypothetical protein